MHKGIYLLFHFELVNPVEVVHCLTRCCNIQIPDCNLNEFWFENKMDNYHPECCGKYFFLISSIYPVDNSDFYIALFHYFTTRKYQNLQ